MIDTTIKITTTTWRQYSMSQLRDTRPILLTKMVTTGTWKQTPNTRSIFARKADDSPTARVARAPGGMNWRKNEKNRGEMTYPRVTPATNSSNENGTSTMVKRRSRRVRAG